MSEYWGRIEELLRQRGLTQERLAKKVGCTPSHISQLKWSKSGASLDLLKKMASVLQVHPLELIADLPPEACKVADEIAALSPERRAAAARLFQVAMEMAEIVSTWKTVGTK